MEIVNDVTALLLKGLNSDKKIQSNELAKKINCIEDECALIDDDTNRMWFEIGVCDGNNMSLKSVHGILCYKYPIAIMLKDMIENKNKLDNQYSNYIKVLRLFDKYEIQYIEIIDRQLCCEAEVLYHYCENKKFKLLNDNFLYDDNLLFDYETYEIIDSGVNYINPMNFNVRDLMEL